MTTQLATRYGENMMLSTDGSISFKSVADVIDYSKLMANAQMLPKGMTPEAATISIIAGASLGMNPFASVQNICSVNGRPTVWGDMMVAIVKGSGLLEDEQVEYFPNQKPAECKGVRYTVKRKGIKTPYVGTFSVEDAKKANLWGKQGPWSTNPVRMLLNRARAFALRDGFADVLKGMRSAEEEQDIERTERYRAEEEAKKQKKQKVANVTSVSDPFADVPTEEPKVLTNKEVNPSGETVVESAEPITEVPSKDEGVEMAKELFG